MNKELFPSMMCADFKNLEKEVKDLENANVDGFHIDFMDGQFVPNFGMGLQDLNTIRRLTHKIVDVHLMIKNPGEYIDLFVKENVDIIYFHPETDMHPTRTIQKIKNNNVEAGIAINPDTSIHTIEPLLNIVDKVMLMTVNPGFAGQNYLDFVNEKIDILTSEIYSRKYNYDIYVDGAISPKKVNMLSDKGVKGFILGTSALFGKDESYTEIINKLRKDEN
ncbi:MULTISPECIES: ribulose-phosphate 3-epimerase [Staphylococcus]|uniref:ribulose-phosphate 3-epimerase n=1 Tax=Staphylococcus TaxID=1279 RepID=UPI000E6A070F|nr:MULTISPECIES: ribulose-phosphate 3-epimerase [Staphylococcus]MDW8552856.1 ribulose-phosphate 3-epimerase [Staphylococcus nepalensis]RIO41499.1 ribulose-phosphate 3-epimerase [Staphylococcus nepalensis]WQL20279.1 ribulose-phosphate 3-epimerase [Staphylococcus nepalensis]